MTEASQGTDSGDSPHDEMTFEQMLLSDDFFSFEAFSQCKKLSEMRQKRGRASYRLVAQRSNQSESDLEKFDIDAYQIESDFAQTKNCLKNFQD